MQIIPYAILEIYSIGCIWYDDTLKCITSMQLFEYTFHSETLYGMMLYGGVKAVGKILSL